jgi:hypothetical protein
MSPRYETSDAVKHVLGERELVPLIGPFAVGKTALMRAAEGLDPDFGRVRSFTTRARRAGESDDAYVFLPHNEDTLRRIHAQATARELVQFIVHPTTGSIYGSTVDSYSTAYSMLDTMPSSLTGLMPLPFRCVKKVAVAVPPDVWKDRVAERLQNDSAEDIRSRIAEGIANITWSLDQGDDLGWIVNGSRNIQDAACDLTSGVRDGFTSSVVARNMAFGLLQSMKALQTGA